MLVIKTEEMEFYDDQTLEFFKVPQRTFKLEHSLISLSKWEAIWEKPFIPPQTGPEEPKTEDELKSYIRCMVIGQPSDLDIDVLWFGHMSEIQRYIESPQSATKIYRHGQPNNKPSRQRITSELIYYWMVAFNIPFECERWHLNRLLTLIDICYIKQDPKKSNLSTKEIYQRNTKTNAKRLAEMAEGG